jgi:hypothetical protein
MKPSGAHEDFLCSLAMKTENQSKESAAMRLAIGNYLAAKSVDFHR